MNFDEIKNEILNRYTKKVIYLPIRRDVIDQAESLAISINKFDDKKYRPYNKAMEEKLEKQQMYERIQDALTQDFFKLTDLYWVVQSGKNGAPFAQLAVKHQDKDGIHYLDYKTKVEVKGDFQSFAKFEVNTQNDGEIISTYRFPKIESAKFYSVVPVGFYEKNEVIAPGKRFCGVEHFLNEKDISLDVHADYDKDINIYIYHANAELRTEKQVDDICRICSRILDKTVKETNQNILESYKRKQKNDKRMAEIMEESKQDEIFRKSREQNVEQDLQLK